MKFKTPVREGIFLRRYKRFFADIRLGTDIVVAHVPNTGSLKTATEPEAPCLISEAANPERKLRWTLEAIKMGSDWVGVNTAWPNSLAEEAFESQIFSHWQPYQELQREVKISPETRLDLRLTAAGKPPHYVEIKNVTMNQDGVARFPDAVTERGQKHLRELVKLVEDGNTAEILFTVQRSDCQSFGPADHIDPEYGKLLRWAEKQGVRITVAVVKITPRGLSLTNQLLPLQF
ncbi:MAG: DNA/RNA nuclease SfsA [Bdellovibrio sp. CG10_big_fil_rev_8_21_14_0_10_47_8]|nr:MAG: DNA/RNA nuclease SfsA [Bdellovibrio sp. CG10_big_fil_rev_8_21_14_0_10_47_8]